MSEARPKRRLPMLNGGSEETEPERPAWHFIVITSLTMLLAWILLAWVVNALLGARVRAGGADVWVTVLNLAVYLLSAFAAAALAGRQSRTARRREACLGGAVTAVLGWSVPFTWFVLYGEGSLTHGLAAWLLLLVAMVVFAVAAAAAGFAVTRKRGSPPS